jgi:hypothetical protein
MWLSRRTELADPSGVIAFGAASTLVQDILDFELARFVAPDVGRGVSWRSREP